MDGYKVKADIEPNDNYQNGVNPKFCVNGK